MLKGRPPRDHAMALCDQFLAAIVASIFDRSTGPVRLTSALVNTVNVLGLSIIALSASPRALVAEQSLGVPAWLKAMSAKAPARSRSRS